MCANWVLIGLFDGSYFQNSTEWFEELVSLSSFHFKQQHSKLIQQQDINLIL
jgi:hypothetical protein